MPSDNLPLNIFAKATNSNAIDRFFFFGGVVGWGWAGFLLYIFLSSFLPFPNYLCIAFVLYI